jgi:hypothetical protein
MKTSLLEHEDVNAAMNKNRIKVLTILCVGVFLFFAFVVRPPWPCWIVLIGGWVVLYYGMAVSGPKKALMRQAQITIWQSMQCIYRHKPYDAEAFRKACSLVNHSHFDAIAQSDPSKPIPREVMMHAMQTLYLLPNESMATLIKLNKLVRIMVWCTTLGAIVRILNLLLSK